MIRAGRAGSLRHDPGKPPSAMTAIAAPARSEESYKGEKFSDHAPITIEYDFKL